MRRILHTNACLFALAHLASGASDAKVKPKYQTFQEMREVILDKKITDLPPLADAAKRKELFERRNDPAQIEALAKELFSLWNTEEKSSSRQAITRNPAARPASADRTLIP